MWTAFLVESLTGAVGAKLPLADDGSWSDPVNSAQSATITVESKWLTRLERWRWSPYAGSVLLCYDDAPIVAGPILKDPSEDLVKQTATFQVGGFWDFLGRRVLTAGDFGAGRHESLASAVATYKGLGLGAIAWEIVQAAQRRPLGSLPVVHGSPYETVAESADRTRTYEGWNLANNAAAKLITEITEVINGPDTCFRPEWTDDTHSQMRWVMVHGTETQPQVDQQHFYSIDLTAPRARVNAVKVASEWSPVTRVYGTGAGEQAGTLIRIVDAPIPQDSRMPFAEQVFSDTQIQNPDLLVRKTSELLRKGGLRTVQVSATMPCADRQQGQVVMPLSSWWAGEAMQVEFPGSLTVKPGSYLMRILKRGGKFGDMCDVEFQAQEVPAW